MATSFSDQALDFMVRVLPIFGSFLFAYNAYLQITQNNDPLLSAFSLAVFLVFLLSVASVSYGHSARSGSEKEKASTLWTVVSLFWWWLLAFFSGLGWFFRQNEAGWFLHLARYQLPHSWDFLSSAEGSLGLLLEVRQI